MKYFAHRDIEVGESQLFGLVENFLMPAANRLSDGNFLNSNNMSVGSTELIDVNENGIDRISLGFYAMALAQVGSITPVRFNIYKSILLEREYSQLAYLSIARDETDSVVDDHEIDQYEYEEMVFFYDDEKSAEGERVFQYTNLDLDYPQMTTYRSSDFLLATNGMISGSFNDNFEEFSNGETNDNDLDDVIEDLDDKFSSYWDKEDLAVVHFVLKSLDLYVPKLN